nr:unnamed protein product [Spirometra erinaceieuropaei]
MQGPVQSSAPNLGKDGAEKTARSIFVGNIPYEATEEKLIELFSKAGPVNGFRLVYDRESGKPKGYGFCEYSNAAIAASALRNLHNIDFNGRPLRIGPAAGEQNSAEVALSNPAVGPPVENAYGAPVDPKHAPEAISRAVASLPPEQMYELMKQMKLCIQNNPNEARNMLLQNPQLAYALLQAQIVMKIVDPKVAIGMLNRSHDQIPPARPDNSKPFEEEQNSFQTPSAHNFQTPHPQPVAPPMPTAQPNQFPHSAVPPLSINSSVTPSQYQQGPAAVPLRSTNPAIPQPTAQIPFTSEYPVISQESISAGMYPGMPGMQPPPPGYPAGPRKPFDAVSNRPPFQPQAGVPATLPNMPMNAPQFMTSVPAVPAPAAPRPSQPSDQITPEVAAAAVANMGPSGLLGAQGEQEKIALIMQVLQLSDESIAQLPEDQRRSILILKEQVRKTGVI